MPRRADHPQVTGVLALHAHGFEQELLRLGYSPFTASEHLYLMADLSRWLDHRGLGLAELSAARAEKFLCERRSKGLAPWRPCWATCGGSASSQSGRHPPRRAHWDGCWASSSSTW